MLEHSQEVMEEVVRDLRERLDAMGCEHEDSSQLITSFGNGHGECIVFPSLQHAGKLYVNYTLAAYVDGAEEALALCHMQPGASDGDE